MLPYTYTLTFSRNGCQTDEVSKRLKAEPVYNFHLEHTTVNTKSID